MLLYPRILYRSCVLGHPLGDRYFHWGRAGPPFFAMEQVDSTVFLLLYIELALRDS